MLEELIKNGLNELGIGFDAVALERLRKYYLALEETNKVMNLTAITGEDAVATLHFLDCAAILREAGISGKTVLDIGTGAGFPGLVLKILRPDTRMILIDSLDKRIGFLRDTCELLGLENVECIHGRAEEAVTDLRETGDLVVSRAVAGLNVLAELCLPYVKKDGLFISMKGPDYEEELEAAKPAVKELGGKTEKCVRYSIPGTEISHSLILVRKLKTTPAKYPRRWAQIKKSPISANTAVLDGGRRA